MFARCCVASLGLFFLAVTVSAQRPGRQPIPPGPAAAPNQVGPPQMVFVPIEVDAQISDLQNGVVSVMDGNARWLLRLGERTEVHLTGMAEPDMLRPGAHVRFLATIDKKAARAVDKVEKLTLITPGKDGDRMLGAFYPQPAAAPQDSQQAPRKIGSPAPPTDDPKRPNRKDEKADEKQELFDIRGQIVAFRANQLTVAVQNTYFRSPLRVDVSDKLEIYVDLAELSYAKAGDRVKGRGVQMMPQTLEMMDIDVVLAEPLTNNPKKKRPTTPPKTLARTKPGTEKPEAFEVAEQIEKERKTAPTPPEPAPQPKADPPAAPPVLPAAPKLAPEEIAARASKILTKLELPPQDRILRGGLQANFNGDKPELFLPAQRLNGAELRKDFGAPEMAQAFSGELPIGEDGGVKKITWQLWTYGSLRVMVDEEGKTQYYRTIEDEGK